MIKPREEILNLNAVFADHLIGVQTAKYKPKKEWKAGDSVILDECDKSVILTREQADELNEEDRQFYDDNRDLYLSTGAYHLIGGVRLIPSEKDPLAYLAALGAALAELTARFGKLIILGDWNTPWLSQENDYQPVAESLAYLKDKIEDDFAGGFVLDKNEIPEFIPRLFWLIRCNAGLPEFMMSFEASKTIFEICKYGAFHLEFYDAAEKEEIKAYFDKRGFQEIERCDDPVEFDRFDGRRIF